MAAAVCLGKGNEKEPEPPALGGPVPVPSAAVYEAGPRARRPRTKARIGAQAAAGTRAKVLPLGQPPPGIFKPLRQSRERATLARVKNFLRKYGGAFQKAAMTIVIQGPRDEAETLQALRDAYQRIVVQQPPPPGDGRNNSRLAEIKNHLAPFAGAGHEMPYYLDIGSSEGNLTTAVVRELKLGPDHATAVDIVPQAENPAFGFKLTDGKKLDFADHTFDLVTMFMSAHHFADAGKMFEEAYRVSKPGALLIIREHGCSDFGSLAFYDFAHAFYATVSGDEMPPARFMAEYIPGEYARYREPEEWKKLVELSGFKSVHVGVPGPDRFDAVILTFIRPEAQ